MISPIRLDGPDDRVTADQLETLEGDLELFGERLRLVGFNDAGWLCYFVDDVQVAVSPEGNPYTGRDAHLRRHEGDDTDIDFEESGE